MQSPEQASQRGSWMALIVVMLGLVAVAAAILWDDLSVPADPPKTARSREPSVAPFMELDALSAALGLRRPAEPSEAPDFTLMTLAGRPTRLREFRGKLVLVNFWATWCAPCLHEMPSMERLYQTFKQTDFVLLAVSIDHQGEEVVRPFVENLKLTFPILLDSTSTIARQYAVRGLPTTYLIDPDGRLIGAVIGARDWYRTEAKTLIASLLRQTQPTANQPVQALQ